MGRGAGLALYNGVSATTEIIVPSAKAGTTAFRSIVEAAP